MLFPQALHLVYQEPRSYQSSLRSRPTMVFLSSLVEGGGHSYFSGVIHQMLESQHFEQPIPDRPIEGFRLFFSPKADLSELIQIRPTGVREDPPCCYLLEGVDDLPSSHLPVIRLEISRRPHFH